MNYFKAITLVRRLAKTNEYQSLYINTKELYFKLFKNERDFSSIQLYLLEFLSFYNTIYTDIYLKEIDSIVLENEIYEDAYIYYKNKKERKIIEEIKQKSDKRNKPIEKMSQVKSQWQFRRNKQ